MEDNKELEKFNTEYIYKRFSSYIDGNNIKFGKPMFTVDMLIQGSVETCNSNPDREITYVVDYMFDYYCNPLAELICQSMFNSTNWFVIYKFV